MGVSFHWEVGPGLDIISEVGVDIEVSVQGSFSGTTHVTAVVGGESVVNNLYAGKPDAGFLQINGLTAVNHGALPTYSIPFIPGATSYEWTLPYPFVVDPVVEVDPSTWKLISNGGSQISALVGPNNGYVQVSGVNPCGESSTKLLWVSVNQPGGGGQGGGLKGGGVPVCCGGGPMPILVMPDDFVLFPNPVNNSLKIQFGDLSMKLFSGEISIEIIDLSGKALLQKKSSSNKIELNTTMIQDGLYILRLSDGLVQYNRNIIVAH